MTAADTWIVKALIFPFALLFIIPPAYKLWDYTQHRLVSVTAEAEVLSIQDGVFMLPVLRYVDEQGKSHQYKSEIPFYFLWAPEPGAQLTVDYLRSDPTVVRTRSFFYYIFYPAAFSLGGLILLRFVFSRTTQEHSS